MPVLSNLILLFFSLVLFIVVGLFVFNHLAIRMVLVDLGRIESAFVELRYLFRRQLQEHFQVVDLVRQLELIVVPAVVQVVEELGWKCVSRSGVGGRRAVAGRVDLHEIFVRLLAGLGDVDDLVLYVFAVEDHEDFLLSLFDLKRRQENYSELVILFARSIYRINHAHRHSSDLWKYFLRFLIVCSTLGCVIKRRENGIAQFVNDTSAEQEPLIIKVIW